MAVLRLLPYKHLSTKIEDGINIVACHEESSWIDDNISQYYEVIFLKLYQIVRRWLWSICDIILYGI